MGFKSAHSGSIVVALARLYRVNAWRRYIFFDFHIYRSGGIRNLE